MMAVKKIENIFEHRSLAKRTLRGALYGHTRSFALIYSITQKICGLQKCCPSKHKYLSRTFSSNFESPHSFACIPTWAHIEVHKLADPCKDTWRKIFSFLLSEFAELKFLRLLKHSNIVRLHRTMRPHSPRFDSVYVVMELLETDLSSIIRSCEVNWCVVYVC